MTTKVLIDGLTRINQRSECAACGDGEGVDLNVELNADSRGNGRVDGFDDHTLGTSLRGASGDGAGGLNNAQTLRQIRGGAFSVGITRL